MKTTVCILLLAAAAWAQEVAVPQGGSLGPSCKLSDAATLGADKVDGSHSSATPTANTVPVADSNGKLAPGWIPLPTGSSIGGIFMSADCLAGNHVNGIDPASGQLKCAADAADWSTVGNKPSAFPPDTSSQAWQDLLAALALKAPSANAALTGTTTAEQIVAATSVQVGSGTPAVTFSYGTAAPTGACTAGMYWRQVSADTVAEFYCNAGSWTASGAGGGSGLSGLTTGALPKATTSSSLADSALSEDSTNVNSSKPVAISGTSKIDSVTEGTPVVAAAGKGTVSFNSSSHRPSYSYDSGAAKDIAYVGDSLTAAQLPKPTTSTLGGVYSDADCASGQHFNGIDTSTGKLKCSADSGGGSTDWVAAPVTTHTPGVAPDSGTNDNGTWHNDVTVIVGGCSGNNAYYSANGTTVTKVPDSPSNTVSITATGTTLKSRCQVAGYDPSAVKSSVYTLQVATPTASPDAGTYSSTQSVTLASTTSGSTIKYCQDSGGTCDPSAGTTYSTAVSVSATGHLRALATKSNYATSGIKDAAYTINTGGGSTPTIVQKKGCASNSNLTSYSCQTTSNIAAVGNLLVVTEAEQGGSAVTLTAPTADCVTGSLTAIGTQFDGTDRQESLHAWYGYTNASGAQCTVTATNTHTGTIAINDIAVNEISGANATSPIVGTPCTGKTSGSSTSSPQCSAAITLSGNDLAFAITTSTAANNWTITSPLTLDYGFLTTTTNTTGTAVYGIVASGAATSSVQPAGTTSSNSYWVIKGFAIKP